MQSLAKHIFSLFIFLSFVSLGKSQKVGQVDKGFGHNGQVLTDYGHSLKQVESVSIQTDGRILVAGNVPTEGVNQVWLSRFHEDGALDRSFGFQGKLPIVELDFVSSLTLTANGDLLVGGSIFNGKDMDFAILCLDEVGMPVRSFADNGLQQLDMKGDEQAVALAIQENGEIVVAGQGAPSRGQSTDFLLACLTPEGQVREDFGLEGVSRIDIGQYDLCRDLSIQPDGKILLGGNSKIQSSYEMAVIRLLASGQPDISFGLNGRRLIPVGIAGDHTRQVLVQEDGKILVSGHTQVADADFDWFVLRLNEDGSPDLNFGNLSIQALNLGKDDFLGGMGLQADGKVLLSGISDFRFSVARLQSDGRFDRSFGIEGINRLEKMELPQVYSSQFQVQEDGKLLLTGASEGDLIMIRLNGCPELPGLGSILNKDWESSDEQITMQLAGGFEMAASFQPRIQPHGKTRGRSSRMATTTQILSVVGFRLGEKTKLMVVIDSEKKAHFFVGKSYVKSSILTGVK